MAAKKKAKATKKKSKAAGKKTRRPASRKAVKKATKKTGRKTAKKATKKKTGAAPARSKPRTAAKKTPARKKAPARKKKQIVGEGDYEASRAFLKDQAGFVRKNKASIPDLGRQAEAALDGPEGDALREAEAAGQARSRDTF